MVCNHDYVIYKAQNELTGEVYVGATSNYFDKRKLDHIERANRGESNKFHDAIGTYGVESFTWTQIDSANSTDELAQKEKEYILEYNSKDQGYNSDSGGGFKKTVYQYDLESGEIVNTFNTLKEAGASVNASRKSINNVCLGVNKTCKGYFWSYTLTEPYVCNTDLRKKKVVQFTLSGNQLAVFNSVAEASRASGISKTCISRVCRGDREQSGGYIWKYVS